MNKQNHKQLDLVDNLPVLTTILGESDIKCESQADKQSSGSAKHTYDIEYGCKGINTITAAAVDFIDISKDQKDDPALMPNFEYLTYNKVLQDLLFLHCMILSFPSVTLQYHRTHLTY